MRNIKKILMVMLLLSLALTVTLGLSSCGKTEVHVHEFEQNILTEATCTEAGEMKLTCACGYSCNEIIPAKGHTEVVLEAVPAKCTEGGLTEGLRCSECNLTLVKQRATSPLGHNPGAAATCTTPQTCQNEGCNLKGGVIAPATGHLTFAPATCTEDEVCTICNAVVTPALGHDEIIIPGYAEGCFTDGLSDGIHCGRCHSVVAEQDIIPANNHKTYATVTPATCYAEGYTTHTCQCGYSSYVDSYTPLAHVWEVVETENGLAKHCTGDCGATEAITADFVNGFKATVNNSFASGRLNTLLFTYAKYGAWGVTVNGGKFSDEYANGIGSLDEPGRSVTYKFVMDEAGLVDFVWTIAGANWDGSGNAGIADMANHMTITIDGKPVDISGLALPDGGQWWNLQKFVVEGVALDAGEHTFQCVINVHGGLNIAKMEVVSNRGVDIRDPKVTSVDMLVENGKIYYVLTLENCNYTLDELSVFDGKKTFAIADYAVDANGNAVVKLDMTNWAVGDEFNPHMSFAGQNYVNDANVNGDIRGDQIPVTDKTISLNGKNYVMYNNWSMAAIKVVENMMQMSAYDIVVENGKPVLLLTYTCIGFDPATAEFFDGSRTLAYTMTQEGNSVTYHIDLTGSSTSDFYFHLRIDGQGWNGKDNVANSKGDVLAPGWTGGSDKNWNWQKEVEVDGVKYKLFIVWAMLVLGH